MFGRGRPEGSLVDWWAVERLLGTLLLPRAVRKPLPQGSAEAVQGLGSRRRLGAAPAADPDGDLPARVPRAVAAVLGRPLPAVSARRPRNVGLLRDDGAGRLTRDARQRRADPQDALSAPACRLLGRRRERRDVRRDARDPAR